MLLVRLERTTTEGWNFPLCQLSYRSKSGRYCCLFTNDRKQHAADAKIVAYNRTQILVQLHICAQALCAGTAANVWFLNGLRRWEI